MAIGVSHYYTMRSDDHQASYTTTLPWNDQVTHVVREFGWRAGKWPREPRGAEVAATLPAGEMCPEAGEINWDNRLGVLHPQRPQGMLLQSLVDIRQSPIDSGHIILTNISFLHPAPCWVTILLFHVSFSH